MPDEEFKRRFQAACVLRGRKMSDVLLELAQEWLEKAEGSQKEPPPTQRGIKERCGNCVGGDRASTCWWQQPWG